MYLMRLCGITLCSPAKTKFSLFYQVLGVDASASQKEIKSTYKSLALKYHPDKEKDPEKKEQVAEKFMEIQKAYDTLTKLNQKRKKTEL